MKYLLCSFLILSTFTMGCQERPNDSAADFETMQDTTDIAYTITGLDGPEAVRYDPEQKVYFISNFTGGGNTQDSTGFITKTDAEGNILDLKFMTGTNAAPLHAPRGMFIVNETLWAADVLGIHGFNRQTGEQTDFIDFSQHDIGFLNDISADKNGSLYITDTGNPRVYVVENETPAIFLDSLPEAPNGITLNPESGEFVLAPWGGKQVFRAFDHDKNLREYAVMDGGNFDGVEFLYSNMLVASQQDSSIRVYDGNENKILIKTSGRPADIGINTNLNHVAVPYIALDRVEIWNLTNK